MTELPVRNTIEIPVRMESEQTEQFDRRVGIFYRGRDMSCKVNFDFRRYVQRGPGESIGFSGCSHRLNDHHYGSIRARCVSTSAVSVTLPVRVTGVLEGIFLGGHAEWLATSAQYSNKAQAWAQFKRGRGVSRIDRPEYRRFVMKVAYLRKNRLQQQAHSSDSNNQLPVLSSGLPVQWSSPFNTDGAKRVEDIPHKGGGLVATVDMPAGHLVAQVDVDADPGVTCYLAGSSDAQTTVVADWYGFGSGQYEIIPAWTQDNNTGTWTLLTSGLFACNEPTQTLLASSLFACNEPTFGNSVNCKVIVSEDQNGRPCTVELFTIRSVEAGEELVIFYGADRHDVSYPRDVERWHEEDAAGHSFLKHHCLA